MNGKHSDPLYLSPSNDQLKEMNDPMYRSNGTYDASYFEETVYGLASSSHSLGSQVREALDVIEKAFDEYGTDATSISFNGGKDCTVLLHLVAAVLSRRRTDKKLRSVFVTYPNPFREVDEFVESCSLRYNLDCVPIPGPMKSALQAFIDESNPKPKAILVGIRRNDPYAGNLSHFNETDRGWPEFTRVHPIIDWSYKDVWDFLLELNVPYCSLYDQGYTSLGSIENTEPNPYLRNTEGGYQPAYKLRDESHERCGRIGSSR